MLSRRILIFLTLFYCKVSAVPSLINRPDLIQGNANRDVVVDSSDVEPVERSGAWSLDGETHVLVTRDPAPASPSRTPPKSSGISRTLSSAYNFVAGKKSGSNNINENNNNMMDRIKQLGSRSGRALSSLGRSLSLSRAPKRQGSLQRKNSQSEGMRRKKTRMGFSTDPHDSPGHPRLKDSAGARKRKVCCCVRKPGTSDGSVAGGVPSPRNKDSSKPSTDVGTPAADKSKGGFLQSRTAKVLCCGLPEYGGIIGATCMICGGVLLCVGDQFIEDCCGGGRGGCCICNASTTGGGLASGNFSLTSTSCM